MIWTVLSVLVCIVICGRLMFFFSGNEHYQSPGIRWLVLITTIYSGSRVITYLYYLRNPTPFTEFLFNVTLLVVVLYYGTRTSKKMKF